MKLYVRRIRFALSLFGAVCALCAHADTRQWGRVPVAPQAAEKRSFAQGSEGVGNAGLGQHEVAAPASLSQSRTVVQVVAGSADEVIAPVTVVPEPKTLGLMLLGLGLIGTIVRRRAKDGS